MTTIRCAPASAATAHSEAAGSTVSVLPTASIRSQPAAARTAPDRTARSSGWPNITVADLSMPPQHSQAGSVSPALTRSSAPAISVRSPQPTQTTPWMVPCSSSTRPVGEPARWCRPSMFCVITQVSIPVASLASAVWAAFGTADQAGCASLARQARRRSSGSQT